ncbi:Beta-galactosidase 7 [Acorus calamus]|uniref:Beta-galactosidase n=1 Tax=Acorus calamus TaxID=4465 RepID=A0AAV9DKF0_ACOCL|nr:Beta-galactosidase 7 [Acorus calamus]
MRKLLISGSIHYPRSTPEMWPELIRKAKKYNFEGRFDLVRFLKTIQEQGLYSILRIGPYVCAEWNYGGLPVWLHQLPGIALRTDNQVFENEMVNFTTLIVNMIKQEGLLAPQGGPIIIAQIENEYGDVEGPYGDAGKRYVQWCANLAESFNIGVPGSCASKVMLHNPWFKNWGGNHPHRPAQDLAFSVARFYQREGTLQNYYMYHGGTNFDRTAGGPLVATSYDYEAPLDEYGNLNQPKWGHLKELHEALIAMGMLSSMEMQITLTTAIMFGVLPDCKTESHNTAKINVQTSLMVRLPNKAESEPSDLSWLWTPEMIGDVLQGNGGHFKTNQLKEQLSVTIDASDYLWYMTRVYLDPKGPNFSNQMTLRVNTRGHGLYAYVNGELVGSQYSTSGNYSFVFEETNYGAFYDTIPVGINGGPVELVTGNTTWDLSSNEWSYKIGLDGETKQIFTSQQIKWFNGEIPARRPFTWYKTTFKAPIGDEAVVLDLNGMGKGAAWVNGKGIGRFWLIKSSPTADNGCAPCSYNGSFYANKCDTNCGKSTERWYHVPRSFLQDDDNTLVLFEEAGGDPLQVSFQTITMGTVCADLEEGHTMNLACQGGHTIGSVGFASFGDPQGTCGGFSEGTCNGVDALAIVEEACFGKTECSIDVNEEMFGSVDCGGITRRLAVQAKCV